MFVNDPPLRTLMPLPPPPPPPAEPLMVAVDPVIDPDIFVLKLIVVALPC